VNIHAQYLAHFTGLKNYLLFCMLSICVEKYCTAFKQYNNMSALATSTIHSYSLTYPTEKLVCRNTFGQLELRLDSWEIIVIQQITLSVFHHRYLCQVFTCSQWRLKRVCYVTLWVTRKYSGYIILVTWVTWDWVNLVNPDFKSVGPPGADRPACWCAQEKMKIYWYTIPRLI